MKRAAALLRPLALLVAVLACLDCSRGGPEMAGGWTDTETGPKITGVIRREDGTPAAGALVLLRPIDYLGRAAEGPDSLGGSPSDGTVRDGVCDAEGRFAFDSVGQGLYTVEARDREIRAVSQRAAIDRPKGLFTLPAAKAGPVGSVLGRVRFADGTAGRVLVRIYGLERAVATDGSGAYFFGNIPAGSYTLHFSGIDPFILPGDKAIQVGRGEATDAGSIVLDRGLRQGFRVAGGRVSLDGVDSANPMVIENGAFRNPVDGAYLWAKASRGSADLRGTIASYAKETGPEAVAANVAHCARFLRIARRSGMRNLPDPVAGALRPLSPAPGGRLEAIKADTSPGALLLVREARKATATRPLLFITGANLTTAAQALLIAPDIADRMVVLGANGDNYNAEDSLAGEVVARKGRFAAWARDYVWSIQGVDWKKPDRFPAHPMGETLRSHYGSDTINPLRAFGYFGDFGPAAWLFRPSAWKSARGMDYAGPALKAVPSAAGSWDFVDIPAEANDWGALNEEFFAGIRDPAAYHPWALPGTVEAEAWSASGKLVLDSSGDGGGEAVAFADSGSWAEYAVRAAAAGTPAIEFSYRAPAPARLIVSGTRSGAPQAIDLPATPGWEAVRVSLPIEAGDQVLRVESSRGAFGLDRFRTVP